ncbi:sensor histidine kinase [Enterococcus faecium]|nr:sensor histidine kinase [Enterococcus faecium]
MTKYQASKKIRPASRHLFTIGEDLIQDKYAAIVELVKNAYDADSPDVIISFDKSKKGILEIIIEDHGHGMTVDDVEKKWLVPSTDNKKKSNVSPKGRIMQGKKGIGRYASNILGDKLLLETTTSEGNTTKVSIDWSKFYQFEYLDEIDILIESEYTGRASGTKLCIEKRIDLESNEDWKIDEINTLRFELKKLIPPETDLVYDHDFKIKLKTKGYFESIEEEIDEEVKPYPIRELYDYRISGQVDANGYGILKYENQKKAKKIENIIFEFGPTECGEINVDIRVYDRDKDGIELLIKRGLKDEKSGNYVSNLEARQLLNEVNGIGVYRNGFRIRPLGNPDNDWLKLNEQRVQNPSLKIGSNQVIGYVYIQSEEISGLEEKSARDGLKNNKHYRGLRKVTQGIILELEKRRFYFRRKNNEPLIDMKVEKNIEKLYDYSTLEKNVSNFLNKSGMSNEEVKVVKEIIEKEQEKKNEVVENIRKTVAIYQGQATIGKIVNIVLHEGRRPLNYFTNQVPNLKFWMDKFITEPTEELEKKLYTISEGITSNTQSFVTLFNKLDPLSSKRKTTKSTFDLPKAILKARDIFSTVIQKQEVEVSFEMPDNLEFFGWEPDIITIFTNLFDNSLFWMDEKNTKTKKIKVILDSEDNNIQIDYFDSGPGIEKFLLDDGLIFDPDFSTKNEGSGLGLPISGEAAERNGFSLTALENDDGAHFRLLFEYEDEESINNDV